MFVVTMRIFTEIKNFFPLLILLFIGININAQTQEIDTIIVKEGQKEQYTDSLEYKASKKKLTKLLYDFLVTPPRPYVDKKELAINYYHQFEGKTIEMIEIKSLDVFGPSFSDTSKVASSWMERTANKVHTKSNLKTIEKLLLFKVGDFVDSEIFYENERIIRSLPYMKEVQFVIEQDSVYEGLVNVTVITKDRFSFGATGNLNGTSSATIELYNQNIFGIGHEISFRFLGHISKQPYLGLETFYKIKNIGGKFLNIAAGYLNTYKNEGFTLLVDKPFLTPSIKWGFGGYAIRMYRTNKILDNDPISIKKPLDLLLISAWGGRSIQILKNRPIPTQMVLSAGFYNREFYNRHIEENNISEYFSNSTFYLAGITFTQRRFVQDKLIYSYGITEDIPEGFKNEIVYGFDANEFGNRHYIHLYLSNGNLLINRKGYLYMAGTIGGYFTRSGYQQGQIMANINFISRQINMGQNSFRFFTKANYSIGMNRFEIENITLNKDNHIRGFRSREVIGKQRLSLNLEYILFLKKELYNFNMAVFGFTDLGVIGTNDLLILTQNYYSGVGLGIRLHNENLVFKTFQLRLAFYPFHPSDMSLVGFLLEEQSKREFYSFEPTAPLPFRFR